MEISKEQKNKIISIWNDYVANNKIVVGIKGKPALDLDSKRSECIFILKPIIKSFLERNISVHQFKTEIDSFNKQNNYWGFTSVKGQMFFNLLVKSNDAEERLKILTNTLINTISFPSTIDDALYRIDKLEKYCKIFFDSAPDKRKAPNPGSTGYFLSYFWQLEDPEKWPIMYSSLLAAWGELGIWKPQIDQQSSFHHFYLLNHEIKTILSEYANESLTNWDIEHAFWNFKRVTAYPKKNKPLPEKKQELRLDPKIDLEVVDLMKPEYKASFELSDYLIPKVSKLVELGSQSEKHASGKGYDFEKLVGEIFKLLDFDVDPLGQGKGRQPDIIIKFREENTAFLVDAKAYSGGYSLGIDDRAIREYISHHCPRLQKEGFKKIGFIIVSNSFKSNFDSFINEITWTTDIKRFILLTSEALLYLLAYKTKDKLSLSAIIENIVSSSNLITAQEVIEEFDDF